MHGSVSMYHASANCFDKVETFKLLRDKQFQFKDTKDLSPSSFIFALRAICLL